MSGNKEIPKMQGRKFQRDMLANQICLMCASTQEIEVREIRIIFQNDISVDVRVESECKKCGYVVIDRFSYEAYEIDIQ